MRRDFPFGLLLGARVHHDFEWKGYHFPKGTLTLLDIYGTHHDLRLWNEPATFWPEWVCLSRPRLDMLPQGGGNQDTGCHCVGE